MGPKLLVFAIGGLILAFLMPLSGGTGRSYLFTETARFDLEAWTRAGERFPAGAQLVLQQGTSRRNLAPEFFASADPSISFDGQRVLFAGKRTANEPWQVWETAFEGGEARQVTSFPEDCIRPFYLPGERCVYSRRTSAGYQVESLSLAGQDPLRLTYVPGNYVTSDVLRDGRVLFEGPQPLGGEGPGELYTVYSDGSGIESYRCDHGSPRFGARQTLSRDILFQTGKGWGKFTSPLSTGTDVAAPAGQYAGSPAEIATDEYLVSFRPGSTGLFGLYQWSAAPAGLRRMNNTSVKHAVQPQWIAPRETPLKHPSGLHDRAGANLLCLDAYTSKTPITEGSIATVRLYTRAAGSPVLLGETPAESDGSFFLHVPTEAPLRLELRDRSGKVIEAEHGWFWMRRGEQRVCVGCHAGPERAPENAVPKVLLRADVPVQMTGGNK